MNAGEMILNILIISIPEEMFLAVIALILMKRVELLDRVYWKKNLLKIMGIVVIPCAICFNLTLELLGSTWNMPINILFFTGCLCILIKSKKYFKVMLFAFISTILFIVIQMTMISILVFILKCEAKDIIGINPISNFKLFLPERVIELGILLVAFIKINSNNNVNIFKYVYNNKNLRSVIYILAIVDLAILLGMSKNIIIENSLSNVSMINQLFIVSSLISVVILTLIIPWIIAFTIYSSENKFMKN